MERENTIYSKNGIAIHTYKNPSLHSFYISLFVRAGSMYEEEGERGMTHFLEHALIRNVNALMDGGLYPLLDRRGIEFNASTYSEMVQFYTSGAKENFAVGAELITRLLSPIVLSSSEFFAEKERIKAEIRESDDRTSLSSFASGIVHEGTSLSYPILGTLGGVSKINSSRLESYRKRVFTEGNIFFYVTGNFDDSDIERLADLASEASIEKGEARHNIAPIPRSFGQRELGVHIKNADFTMVRFNFDMDMSKLACGVDDLLYDILLGGYNSRFFIEMSEKKGLFYDLSGAVEKYGNVGTFTFSYEIRGGSVYDAVNMTLSILTELKEELLCEDGCMKAGYVDNGRLLYDDSRDLNFTFAYDRHIMNAPYRNIEERAEYYSKITPEDIRAAARQIFRAENLSLTMKANKKKLDLSRIEKILSDWKSSDLQ